MPLFDVTDVTNVRSSIRANLDVTSGVTPDLPGVTARPPIRADTASGSIIGPKLVGDDRIQAQQPAADALRLGAFCAAVGLG